MVMGQFKIWTEVVDQFSLGVSKGGVAGGMFHHDLYKYCRKIDGLDIIGAYLLDPQVASNHCSEGKSIELVGARFRVEP